MQLVFATNNAHKLAEARQILGERVEVVSLKDMGINEDIPENYPTLQENSIIKAAYIHEKYGYDCFADDTGLEIESLGGEPGVYSARYTGEPSDPAKNRAKVLEKMKGQSNRNAQFRTVVTLIIGKEMWQTEGIVKGRIETEERGDKSFGYDCIFTPAGYDKTFGELAHEIKNTISHRAMAMKNLADYLKNL
ncbi:MAG: RdgB/HAM1 family non-canonical purine NTP pyrophosphatase [Paludibacteraceae bacterium]|nr:RdgB/HAM1 family non-canonical purine NTP pyrophosphatase [Paludibacteraceae bacterium]